MSRSLFDLEIFIRKPGEFDGWLLLSGLATLLQQLHPQARGLSLLILYSRLSIYAVLFIQPSSIIVFILISSWNASKKVGKMVVEKLTHARDSFTLASDHQEVLPP